MDSVLAASFVWVHPTSQKMGKPKKPKAHIYTTGAAKLSGPPEVDVVKKNTGEELKCPYCEAAGVMKVLLLRGMHAVPQEQRTRADAALCRRSTSKTAD